MPATVDNNTLLKAFNQTIQALLDLATSISSNSNGCPDVTVNVPASEPVINVYNTVKCGGCGSGGSGSVGSGSPVDSDPTDGYTPGNDPVIDAAKCKRVNYVIDKYLDFLGLWGAVEGLLAIGPAEALAAYLLGSGSLVFSSILVAGALITLFWSVVTLFTGGLVIFSYIVAHAVDVRANREELTCAMYNAATPGDMRQAIIDFMSNHLAGLPQSFVTYHVDAIFSNNVLNGVFNGWTDAGVIAELSAYTPPVGCDGCGSEFAHWIIMKYEQYAYGSFGTLDNGQVVEGGIESDSFEVVSWHSIWDNMRMLGITGNATGSVRMQLSLSGFTPRNDFNGNCIMYHDQYGDHQTISAENIQSFYDIMSDLTINSHPSMGIQLVGSTDFTMHVTVL